MFEKKNGFGTLALAFLAGAVAGAATALLLTPITGRKLQKQIRSAVEDHLDNAGRILKKVV